MLPWFGASPRSPSRSGSTRLGRRITLEVYAHLFARTDPAATERTALDASCATITGTDGVTRAGGVGNAPSRW